MVVSVFAACGALLGLLIAAPEGSGPAILTVRLLIFLMLAIFSAAFTFLLFMVPKVFGDEWRSPWHWKGWLLAASMLPCVGLWAMTMRITADALGDAISAATHLLHAAPIPAP
ncbi:MAG: hypothetical protein QM682_07820 [Paracoccus sp. (in: a-proteobacteria)]|uniref:hypothetical protein n=1 Tax=Paracoccus sp. TaxID=267 RepID=UPI0039E6B9F9